MWSTQNTVSETLSLCKSCLEYGLAQNVQEIKKNIPNFFLHRAELYILFVIVANSTFENECIFIFVKYT